MLAFHRRMHELHSYAYVARSYAIVVLLMFTFNISMVECMRSQLDICNACGSILSNYPFYSK
jgi:hypothetical protein